MTRQEQFEHYCAVLHSRYTHRHSTACEVFMRLVRELWKLTDLLKLSAAGKSFQSVNLKTGTTIATQGHISEQHRLYTTSCLERVECKVSMRAKSVTSVNSIICTQPHAWNMWSVSMHARSITSQ